MYVAPKLEKYGSFRELTRQTAVCEGPPTWTGKNSTGFDPYHTPGLVLPGEECAIRS